MKVCHLTSVHTESDTRIFIKECQSLAQANYNVSYIVPSEVEETTIINKVVIHKIKKIKDSRFKRMTKTVWNVYKKAIEVDADIYHFHDPELLIIGEILLRKGKKVIYDVHEDVSNQILNKKWLPFKSQTIVSYLFEKYENRVMKKFSLVVAATPFIKEKIEKLGINVINVNNYPIIQEFISNNEISNESKKSICYAGSISNIRGLKEMIEALEETDNVELLLAGEFSYESEKNYAQKMIGWSSVHELGFLNRKEINEIYSKSFAGLVLLHPYINYLDSLPVKMFEYMAAGVPVIASDFPYWKNIINENECGVCVNPFNISEIANAITYLKENREIAIKMGENGKKAALDIYNWNHESAKLIAAYQSL